MSDFKKRMNKLGEKDDSGEVRRPFSIRMSETSDFEKRGKIGYPRKTIRRASSPTHVARRRLGYSPRKKRTQHAINWVLTTHLVQ